MSKEIGKMKEKPPELMTEMRQIGDTIKSSDAEMSALESLNDLFVAGAKHACPMRFLLVKRRRERSGLDWGVPRNFDFIPRAHWEIAEKI